MSEEGNDGVSTLQCALVMIDVLGFKEKLKGENRLLEFRRFSETAGEMFQVFGDQPTGDIHDLLRIEGQHTLLYSDTFLFYQPVLSGGLPVDALVSAAAFAIRVTGAGLEQGFLMRGAISFGELLVSSRIPAIAGPVVIECAEHFESTEWVGCHLTPSAARIVEAAPAERRARFLRFFQRANVPFQLKGGAVLSAEMWATKWHGHLRETIPGHHQALFPGPLRTQMDQYEQEGKATEDAVTDYFRSLLVQYARQNPAVDRKVQNTLTSLF